MRRVQRVGLREFGGQLCKPVGVGNEIGGIDSDRSTHIFKFNIQAGDLIHCFSLQSKNVNPLRTETRQPCFLRTRLIFGESVTRCDWSRLTTTHC